MKSVIRNTFMFILLTIAILCATVCFSISKVNASSTITSFAISGGQVKFASDPTYNGVRFPVVMSESDYDTFVKGGLIEYTGTVICDASKVSGDLTIGTPNSVNVNTTSYWKESVDNGFMEATVFSYGIPDTAEAYTNKFAVVGYYKLNNDANIYYTETVTRSSAQIAYSAYNDRTIEQDEEHPYLTADGDYSPFPTDQLGSLNTYIPDLTVTFIANGSTVETKTVTYGDELLELPTAPDRMGYEFSSWQYNNTDYDFSKGVTENLTLTAKYVEKTYVYGNGFDVIPATGAFASVEEVKVSEGENEGKWYRRITKTSGSGSGSFTISASESAGLEPNTVYLVNVVIDTDGTHPAYYREATPETVKYGEKFYRMAGKSDTIFYVTTDENGGFTKVVDKTFWNSGTYVNFSGLTVMKAAYDKGLQIVNYTGSQTTNIVEGIFDDGNGVATTQLTRKSGNASVDVYINATADAKLKANTTYNVTVSVKNNCKFFENNSAWVMAGTSGQINFTITTDASGEFSKKYSVSITEYGSYVRFTDIEVTEVVG